MIILNCFALYSIYLQEQLPTDVVRVNKLFHDAIEAGISIQVKLSDCKIDCKHIATFYVCIFIFFFACLNITRILPFLR